MMPPVPFAPEPAAARPANTLRPAGNLARLRSIFCLVLGLVTLFAFGGCSMYLARHTLGHVTNLRPESPRADLIREVGPPRQSVVYARPVKAWGVDLEEGKALRLDEFKLGGWRLVPHDSIDIQTGWDWYWTSFIGSAGTSEFTVLPATVGKLARHASQSQDIWVWYDRADRVISFDTESPAQRAKELADAPLGWALRKP